MLQLKLVWSLLVFMDIGGMAVKLAVDNMASDGHALQRKEGVGDWRCNVSARP